MDWINVQGSPGWGQVVGSYEEDSEVWSSIECGQFLDHMRNC